MSKLIEVITEDGEHYVCNLDNNVMYGGIIDQPVKFYNSKLNFMIGENINFDLGDTIITTAPIKSVYYSRELQKENERKKVKYAGQYDRLSKTKISKIYMYNQFGTEYICDLKNKTFQGGAINTPEKYILSNLPDNWEEDVSLLEKVRKGVNFTLEQTFPGSTEHLVCRTGYIESFKVEREVPAYNDMCI